MIISQQLRATARRAGGIATDPAKLQPGDKFHLFLSRGTRVDTEETWIHERFEDCTHVSRNERSGKLNFGSGELPVVKLPGVYVRPKKSQTA